MDSLSQTARRDPRELRPHPKNSRRHPKEQIEHLKRSLAEFGVMRPVLVDEEGVVLAGHGVYRQGPPPLWRADLMRRPILNHTDAGDWIYDPFVGTGTTLIAAEQSERRCIAIDLMPEVVDIVIERWQKFTGREAVLEARE